MKTNTAAVLFGTMVTGVLLVGSTLEGCRSDPAAATGGSSGTSTSSGSTSTSGASSSSSGGNATEVTIAQITDPMATGHVGAKTPIKVVNVVAMTTKFLVAKSSSSGSCLWGVFVSSPTITETAPNTGILAVSFGTPAVAVDGGKAYCPVIQANQPAGDAFPDDVKPGDVLDILGTTDAYIPATCTAGDAGPGASMVPGLQISKVTSVMRHGTAAVPAAHKLTTSDLNTLASGSDMSWLNQWGNVKIEADMVIAKDQLGALTDSYGHMLLDIGSNGIQVGDKLYYVGYVKAGDACYSGPQFATVPPLKFNSITGFVYLDYCNWSIAPSSKCADLNPPSDDCASVADAGSPVDGGDGGDGGTPLICTH